MPSSELQDVRLGNADGEATHVEEEMPSSELQDGRLGNGDGEATHVQKEDVWMTLQVEYHKAKSELNVMRVTLADLRDEVEDRCTLTKQIADKLVADRDKQLADKNKVQQILDKQISEKDKQIADLQAKLAEMTDACLNKPEPWRSAAELEAMKSKCEKMTSQTDKLRAMTQRLEKQLQFAHQRWNHDNCENDPHIMLRVFGSERPDAWQAEQGLDSWTDCTVLHRKYHNGHQPCCGANGSIMLESATHEQCWYMLRACHRTLRNAKAKGRRVTHGLRCNHAKHRSESFKHLLRAALENDGMVVHHENFSPWYACRCPDACPNLTAAQREKCRKDGEVAIQVVIRYWKEISGKE